MLENLYKCGLVSEETLKKKEEFVNEHPFLFGTIVGAEVYILAFGALVYTASAANRIVRVFTKH